MSENIIPIKSIAIISPIVDHNEIQEPKMGIFLGPRQANIRKYPSSTSTTGGVQFNITPPSNSFVSRRMMIRVPITCTFTCIAPLGQKVLQTGYDAPRAYPLHSTMSTLSVTFNGTTITVSPYDHIKELNHFYNTHEKFNKDYSTTCTMFDNCQEYSDVYGTNRNPLDISTNNSFRIPRGNGMIVTNLVNPIGDGISVMTATIDMVFTEPLYISPNIGSLKQQAGYWGLETLDVRLDFKNDFMKYFWSHNNANITFTSTSAQLGNSNLLLEIATPKLSMPQAVVGIYGYYFLKKFRNERNVSVAPNATETLNSDTFILNSIPNRVLIWVNEKESNKTINTADFYMRIEDISIEYLNKAGILSNTGPEQLYMLSAKNGYSESFNNWYANITYQTIGATTTLIPGGGSILCLEFGSDIALPENLVPGQSYKENFTFQIRVKNMNQTRNITPTLNVLFVHAGTMNLVDGKCITQTGIITQKQAIAAQSPKFPRIAYGDYIEDIYGGSKFGDFMRKVGSFLWRGIKYIAPKVLPLLMAAGEESDDLYDTIDNMSIDSGGALVTVDKQGGFFRGRNLLNARSGGKQLQKKKAGLKAGGKRLTKKDYLKML